jgi:ABC-type nitrate/sulfonate/bicarbonate transport system substrate-binding protein
MPSKNTSTPARRNHPQLKIGYVALTDAAPLLAARELGYFERHGLNVELTREVGWATIRDKVLFRELHAAHALAGMLFATRLGAGCPPSAVSTALVLNNHGNAITISTRIPIDVVRNPAKFQAEARERRGEDKLTFGVVSPWSSHNIQLRRWLINSGINPKTDVRIAVVPPGQVCRNLAAGTIDGFCAGEPWNSYAVQEGTGVVVSCSAQDDEGHIEKVLMVRDDFAHSHEDAHLALIKAVEEACEWCDRPENRVALTEILADTAALNLPAEVIKPGIVGPFDRGDGNTFKCDDFFVFHRGNINTPSPYRAEAILRDLIEAELIPDSTGIPPGLTAQLFREDTFFKATGKSNSHELQSK